MPLADDVDLSSLASRSERFTGADLEDLVRRAGLTALRRGLDAGKVTMADFEAALVREQMGGAAQLKVPLDVSIGTGHSWHEAAH